MRIMSVFGTRPEAIKMSRVIHWLNEHENFDSRVCVTGQHRELLDATLRLFEINPHYDLNIMSDNQSLSDITTRVLSKLKVIYQKEKPDLVLVQGDAMTTLASSLAAYYQNIPVAHIEAGLRTNNLDAPFPEETNRRYVSRIAQWHFAPTEWARLNLLLENVDSRNIHVTGNTVIDALLWVKNRVMGKDFSQFYGSANEIIHSSLPVILVTGHRRENCGEGLRNLCRALSYLAHQHCDWHFVYPVHLQPEVRRLIHQHLDHIHNIHLLEPLDYAPFIQLMNRAKLIITDSGSIQEEAPSLGKPVLVTRNLTERPESVEAGTSIVVGTDFERIVAETESLLQDDWRYTQMIGIRNPYGDGEAASHIVRILEQYLVNKPPRR